MSMITEEMVNDFEEAMWAYDFLRYKSMTDGDGEVRGLYVEQEMTPGGPRLLHSEWRIRPTTPTLEDNPNVDH